MGVKREMSVAFFAPGVACAARCACSPRSACSMPAGRLLLPPPNRQCDGLVAHPPVSRMMRTARRHCTLSRCCWTPAAAAIAGWCFSTKLVSTDAGAVAVCSGQFELQRTIAAGVRQQDCPAALWHEAARAAAGAAARLWQLERARRQGFPTQAKRLQKAAAVASGARWSAAMRHCAVQAVAS